VRTTRWLVLVPAAAYALCFAAAVVLLGEQLGSVGDSDRQFDAYVGNEDNRLRDIAGAYALAAAGLAFLWLIEAGARRLPRGESGIALSLARSTAAIYAGLMAAAAAALSAVAWSLTFSDIFDEEPHTFSAETARLATQLGLGCIIFGALAAGASIAAYSAEALARNDLPRWAAAAGCVTAAAQLLAVFYMPMMLLPLWALVAGVVLSRRAV
jgi:hypothetical protein